MIGFSYSQPLLINRVIDFVGDSFGSTSSNNGYGLIGATALVYFGVAVCKLEDQIDYSLTLITDLECHLQASGISARHSSPWHTYHSYLHEELERGR